MSRTNNGGLAKADELYRERSKRARELKAEGKRIIGYFCCYLPLEILTAADLVPFRIMGDVGEPITRADAYLETIICPFIRSCFDLTLKGKYEFLDGLVIPNTCDGFEYSYNIWRYYLNLPFYHFLDIPHKVDPSSHLFFRAALKDLKEDLEEFSGREISEHSLVEAIQIHNENRALIRDLYELRKLSPPLLAGTEMIQIIVSALSLPVAEANELLRSIVRGVKQDKVLDREKGTKKEKPLTHPVRLLLYGGEVDNIAFFQLIEDCGADIVMDDMCLGTRQFWREVEIAPDILQGIASAYLEQTMCPRTCREEGAQKRFEYLVQYARDFAVDGAILDIPQFCDTYEFDVPDVRDLLQRSGFPVLHIEDDYSLSGMERLRTRVQAFVEMVKDKS